MDEHKHHEQLIDGISKQFKEILENSGQGMYIYLDDIHKICNEKFAKMLGYTSAKDWSSAIQPFTELFVDKGSPSILVHAYRSAMEKGIGSSFDINWKTKNGKSLKTNVILVPIAFEGHLMALHFVTKK